MNSNGQNSAGNSWFRIAVVLSIDEGSAGLLAAEIGRNSRAADWLPGESGDEVVAQAGLSI